MANEPTWEQCEAGEITAMVDRRRRAQRARTTSRLVVGTASLAVLVGTCAVWFANPKGYVFGGIDCKECMTHAKAYFAEEIDDPDLRESVRIHLEECPRCHPHVEELKREVRVRVAPAAVAVR